MRSGLRIALGLSVLFLLACSAKEPTDPMAALGVETFGAKERFITFVVPDEEQQPFRLSRSTPAGRRLAELFAPAAKSVVRIVVAGPSSESTKKAILEAFKLRRGELLGGLEIVFVGELSDAEEIAARAKPHLATIHFRAL